MVRNTLFPCMAKLATLVLLTVGLAAGTQAESKLMQGFPPDEERIVTLANFMEPPYNRWAFQHMRELVPTRAVYRGDGLVETLEEAPLPLDELQFTLHDGRRIDLSIWLSESKADSFLVMHRGKVVYERYLNGMVPHRPHQMFSATKSLVGTLTLMLIEEGWIDPENR